MNTFRPFRRVLLVCSSLLALSFLSSHAQSASAVTVSQDDSSYTLANGIVAAKVAKRDGKLLSLTYKSIETIAPVGRAGGYWSHSAASPATTDTITIDPKTNGGERV